MPSLSWIQIGLGALAAFALSYLLHTVSVNAIEKEWAIKLEEQAAKLDKQCKDDQQITKGTNDEISKNLADTKRKLAEYKRLRPNVCIYPTTGQANGAGPGRKPTGQNGVSTDELYDYGAGCEDIRKIAKEWEGFVDKVWESRDQ